MIIKEDDYLIHYGILRKSGRYPWGSGGNDSAPRHKQFLDYISDLKKQGLSDVEIARGLDITTTQYRALKSIAKNEKKQADIAMAQRLKDKGYSNVAIGERMGVNESSVRALLAPGAKDKADVLESTKQMLRDQVAQKGMIDVGSGVEYHVGVTRDKLNVAIAALKEEGYDVHYVKIPQLGTGLNTSAKVLVPPGQSYSETYKNRDKIAQITDYSQDGGRTFFGIHTPISIDQKRVGVNWAEDGGTAADGVIYVRPGVPDVSLGASRYAQVRIAVNGTHYLKGMAVYKDDLPDGVDLVFNTNKSRSVNKLDAMKPMKDDPDNPFGAVIRQIHGPDGKPSSAMNIVNEEGDWSTWSKNLPSQMLSKQNPTLAKSQLDMTYERRKSQYDEIMSLTNPTVRKKLLESYADDADSAAVHLKAAQIKGQATHVILPVPKMKENEIHAPNYNNGDRVVLIRFPHGGTFEIPELTVNNRNPDAKKLLGNAPDAVGIHPKVAERLSGADFDGDTVLVIPNNSGKVKSSPALEGLKNFDPKASYPAYEGMTRMSARTKAIEMGNVSNLITDMTIHGASNAELARAVRHSMVVIDAEKHNLNYKQSAIDNGIAQLKTKYQGSARSGASTLISRATAEVRVPERKPRSAAKGGPIDKETGKRVYEPTGATYVNKAGKTVLRTEKSQKLAETDDAHTLSSGTPIEKLYADHSNRLKNLANDARRHAVNTKSIPYSPSAKTHYATEVASLNSKLNLALRNAPLERQAQVLGNAVVSAKRQANPDMDAADLKKIQAQALEEARTRTGAKKQQIVITQSEWDAIQAGAISNTRLSQILDNADLETVKKLATPRTDLLMTSTKQARAQAMLASGYTQAEVAQALGVSLSTLKKSLSS